MNKKHIINDNTLDICFICLGKGFYKDDEGVWHACPRCGGFGPIKPPPMQFPPYITYQGHCLTEQCTCPRHSGRMIV